MRIGASSVDSDLPPPYFIKDVKPPNILWWHNNEWLRRHGLQHRICRHHKRYNCPYCEQSIQKPEAFSWCRIIAFIVIFSLLITCGIILIVVIT